MTIPKDESKILEAIQAVHSDYLSSFDGDGSTIEDKKKILSIVASAVDPLIHAAALSLQSDGAINYFEKTLFAQYDADWQDRASQLGLEFDYDVESENPNNYVLKQLKEGIDNEPSCTV